LVLDILGHPNENYINFRKFLWSSLIFLSTISTLLLSICFYYPNLLMISLCFFNILLGILVYGMYYDMNRFIIQNNIEEFHID